MFGPHVSRDKVFACNPEEDFAEVIETTPEVTPEGFEDLTHPGILFDADALKDVHDKLWSLRIMLDEEVNVPDRYGNSVVSHLSDMDSDTIALCSRVVHRLYLDAKYLNIDTGRYWKREEESE